jgi:hypothetical protein
MKTKDVKTKDVKIKQGEGPAGTKEEFLQELFVTRDGVGEESRYNMVYDDKVDAVQEGNPSCTLVATYKLVKVERLALKRSTKVVTLKDPK